MPLFGSFMDGTAPSSGTNYLRGFDDGFVFNLNMKYCYTGHCVRYCFMRFRRLLSQDVRYFENKSFHTREPQKNRKVFNFKTL